MQQQNFKNHSRLVTVYHYVLFTVLLATLVLTIINVVENYRQGNNLMQSIILLLMTASFTIVFLIVRQFPLKA